jgi:hypothetical protein
LTLIGSLLIGWLLFEHQTRFAPALDEYSFGKVRSGMTFAEVYDRLGAAIGDMGVEGALVKSLSMTRLVRQFSQTELSKVSGILLKFLGSEYHRLNL